MSEIPPRPLPELTPRRLLGAAAMFVVAVGFATGLETEWNETHESRAAVKELDGCLDELSRVDGVSLGITSFADLQEVQEGCPSDMLAAAGVEPGYSDEDKTAALVAATEDAAGESSFSFTDVAGTAAKTAGNFTIAAAVYGFWPEIRRFLMRAGRNRGSDWH